MAGLLREIRMREEAERAQAVVEGDDDRTFGREVLAVIPGHAARATGEAAAVDPHHHRSLVDRGPGARPDVEVEAVFATCRLAGRGGRRRRLSTGSRAARTTIAAATSAERRTGRAWRAERVGVSYAVP